MDPPGCPGQFHGDPWGSLPLRSDPGGAPASRNLISSSRRGDPPGVPQGDPRGRSRRVCCHPPSCRALLCVIVLLSRPMPRSSGKLILSRQFCYSGILARCRFSIVLLSRFIPLRSLCRSVLICSPAVRSNAWTPCSTGLCRAVQWTRSFSAVASCFALQALYIGRVPVYSLNGGILGGEKSYN